MQKWARIFIKALHLKKKIKYQNITQMVCTHNTDLRIKVLLQCTCRSFCNFLGMFSLEITKKKLQQIQETYTRLSEPIAFALSLGTQW